MATPDTIITTVRKTAAVVTSVSSGDSSPWTNLATVSIEKPNLPTDPVGDPSTYAKCVIEYTAPGVDDYSDYLVCSDFGFEVPRNAEITDMFLEVKRASHGRIQDSLAMAESSTEIYNKKDAYSTTPWGGGYWQEEEYNLYYYYWAGRPPVGVSKPPEGLDDVYVLFRVVRDHYAGFGDSTAQVGHVVLQVSYEESYLNLETFGGIQVGGISYLPKKTTTLEGSGGISLSGLSPNSSAIGIDGGKVQVSGSHILLHKYIPPTSGGMTSGGTADVVLLDIIEVGGGITSSGDSVAHHFYDPKGGLLHFGEAESILTYLPQGGIFVGRSASLHTGGIHNISFIGGSIASGESDNVGFMHRIVEAEGGVQTDNPDPSYGIRNWAFTATGGVYVSNKLVPSEINHRFYLDTSVTWATRTTIKKDLTFRWSTGQLIVYWYRVLSKPIINECEADECCQKMVMNVHARTAAELCEKLSARGWSWPIQTVQRYKSPAALGNILPDWEDQQEYIDSLGETTDECLDPIDICSIPVCADFCVDIDIQMFAETGFDITNVIVDGWFDHESGNGVAADRSVYIAGAADVTWEKFTPAFTHEPVFDGSLTLSGIAEQVPSHDMGNNGAIVHGSSDTAFSHWLYTGGVWPFYRYDAIPYSVENMSYLIDEDSTLEGEIAWQPNVQSQVNISGGKTSQFLVFSDFKLDIPLTGLRRVPLRVTDIFVHINRWTTQVGTEDLRFFLVNGNEVISNNVEQTGFRWPLIPTTITYGDDPTQFEPNKNSFRNEDELLWAPWDISVLNGKDFGVAIQVEDVVGAGGTYGYVESVSIDVKYEFVEHQTLKTGGTAVVVASAYNFTGSGSVSMGGSGANNGGGVAAAFSFISTGIGVGQPTSVVFAGSHARPFVYEVPDLNTVWWDSGLPINEDNISLPYPDAPASYFLSGDHQPLEDFGAVGSNVSEWEDSTSVAPSDAVFAYVNLSPDGTNSDATNSDFLVVRGIAEESWLAMEDHWEIHGIRIIMGLRSTTNEPYNFEGEFIDEDPIVGGGIKVGDGSDWGGGLKASGVAEQTLEDVTDVRDRYVYLVRGNKIISDNVAKDEPWLAFPGETVFYGSSGRDGAQQLRNTELAPWSVEEIQDPEFGVAIAVSNLGVSAETYAQIDTIVIELTAEAWGRVETLRTHLNVGSGSIFYPNIILGTGGATAGGRADVEPYWDAVEGGISVGGETLAGQKFLHVASGTLNWGGEGDVVYDDPKKVGVGGVALTGLTTSACSNHSFVSDGNAIFVLGGAGIKSTSVESQLVTMQADMKIVEIGGIFSEDVDEDDIETLTTGIAQCGCLSIPLSITVQHNFVRDNIIAKFLLRNGFSVSSEIELDYNVPNDSWQANLHYKGLSADANTEEKWDLVFEVQCTSNMGGVEVGRNVWKLGISVFRKNLTTGEDFDTRMVIGVMPDVICQTNANELEFKAIFDTQNNYASIYPENAVLYQNTLYDNIGLFKNGSWVSHSDLVLSVSQSGFNESPQTVDLYNAVQPVDEMGLLPSS